jgi:hypothetical protein
MNIMMKRQGDLLIINIEKLPKGSQAKDSRVLAEGEVTGHLHELTGGNVFEANGDLYFTVPLGSEVTLTHPEHAPLVFTPGTYEVIRQREYQPAGWRHVSD